MARQGLAGRLGLRAVAGRRLVNPVRTVRRAGSYPSRPRTGDGTADGRTRSGRRQRAPDGSSRLRGPVPARGHIRDSTGHSWRERRDHLTGPRSRRRQKGLNKIRTRLAFRQMEEGVTPRVGPSISFTTGDAPRRVGARGDGALSTAGARDYSAARASSPFVGLGAGTRLWRSPRTPRTKLR